MREIAKVFFLIISIFSNLYSQGIPYGQEFQIKTFTDGDQMVSSVSTLSDGGFIVCWNNYKQDGSLAGAFGQLFDSFGGKKGTEFQVNTNRLASFSSVAGLCDGGFIICWTEWKQNNWETDVIGQLFDASGARVGGKFVINSYTKSFQEYPNVISLSSGDFVVCWSRLGSGWDIFGQLFDSHGKRKNIEFQVNTTIENDQFNPKIAALTSGGFFICWVSWQEKGIFGQLYDADGVKLGNQIKINSNCSNYVEFYNVTGLSNGSFVVCWQEYASTNRKVFGQLFDAFANKKGIEFCISETQKEYYQPSVAGLPDKGFVVCWQLCGVDGSDLGIVCRLYDERNIQKSDSFLINSYTHRAQAYPQVAALTEGGFVVCWQSREQDGNGAGIFGKRFAPPRQVPLHEYSLLEPKNDVTIADLPLRFIWRNPIDFQKFYPWEITYNLYIDNDSNFPHTQIIKDIQDTTYTIDSIAAGKTYFWKVLAKNLAGDSLWSTQQDWGFYIHPGATSAESAVQILPMDFELFQNYPNPFNSSTEIKYFLPNVKASYKVQVKIYDILGRLVRVLVDQEQFAGSYRVSWDGTDLGGICVASGVYFYSLEAGDLKSIRKMLVLQ